MLIPSLLILFLLIVPFSEAYTVITLQGKRFEGTLITDNQNTIVIKDTQGVLMSFKKQMLDLEKMRLANAEQIPEGRIHQEKSSVKRELSLVDLANRLKAERTGNSHSLTMEDLASAPQLSVMGNDENLSNRNVKEDAPDESKWASRLKALKKEVNRLTERKISAEPACEQSKQKQFRARTTGHEQPSDLLSTYKETPQCSRLNEIERQLQEAQTRLEDAREEGRRAGVSWQTLE